MIIIIFGTIIIFFALRLLLIKFMTEKRQFTFKDKIIFTMGGFVGLNIFGAIQDDIFFYVMSLPFFAHWIILITPESIKKWRLYLKCLK